MQSITAAVTDMWRGVLIILVLLGLIVGGLFFFLSGSRPSVEEPEPDDTAEFPLAPPGAGSGAVSAPVNTFFLPTTIDGVSIIVHDFTKDSGTKPDPADSSLYYLVGTTGSAYRISYSATTKIFTITIYQEPVGGYRDAASLELVKLLKVTEKEACLLASIVTIAPEANPHFANKNLGLSFCPGATELPK